MGLQDTLLGTPGQTQVHQAAGTKPPGYGFARDFFNQLMGIANNNPYPTYQGQLDPGMSPTLQNAMRGAQGFQQSSMPEIMGGVNGALGGMMSPGYINPQWRLQGGFNSPFSSSFSPDTKIFNGNPMSSYFGLKPQGGGNPFEQQSGGPQSMNGGGLQGSMPPPQGGGGGGFPQLSFGGQGGLTSMNGGGLQGSMPGGMGMGGAMPPPPGPKFPGGPQMGGGGWASTGGEMPYGGGPMPGPPQDTTYTSNATPMPKAPWAPGSWR